MTTYRHTQPGVVMRAMFGASIVFCAVMAGVVGAKDPDGLYVLLAVAAVIALALALFHSLTVTVNRDEVRLRFGIGLIRNGWLYNVSGFDAVELSIANGKVCRIGTDEPRRLLKAIEKVAGL